MIQQPTPQQVHLPLISWIVGRRSQEEQESLSRTGRHSKLSPPSFLPTPRTTLHLLELDKEASAAAVSMDYMRAMAASTISTPNCCRPSTRSHRASALLLQSSPPTLTLLSPSVPLRPTLTRPSSSRVINATRKDGSRSSHLGSSEGDQPSRFQETMGRELVV